MVSSSHRSLPDGVGDDVATSIIESYTVADPDGVDGRTSCSTIMDFNRSFFRFALIIES